MFHNIHSLRRLFLWFVFIIVCPLSVALPRLSTNANNTEGQLQVKEVLVGSEEHSLTVEIAPPEEGKALPESLTRRKVTCAEKLRVRLRESTNDSSLIHRFDVDEVPRYMLEIHNRMRHADKLEGGSMLGQKVESEQSVLGLKPLAGIHGRKDVLLLFNVTRLRGTPEADLTAIHLLVYKKLSEWPKLRLKNRVILVIEMGIHHDDEPCHQTAMWVKRTGGRVLFNVTSEIRQVLLLASQSETLRVSLKMHLVRNGKKTKVNIMRYFKVLENTEGPLLVVYKNVDPTSLRDVSKETSRPRRSVDSIEVDVPENNIVRNDCSLHRWKLDFSILEWGSWMIYPKVYTANFCSGLCPSLLVSSIFNVTNHAYLKNMYHSATGWQHTDVPQACCVPVRLLPITLLYEDFDNSVVSRRMQEMTAVGCACV